MHIKKVSIFGHGTTGEALSTYLETTNPNLEIAIRDPKKGFEDNILGAEYAFICVPVPVSDDYKQDLTMVMDCIERVHPTTIPIIRSTIAPGTIQKLEKQYNRTIAHMPEFLTARTAIQDMFDQRYLYLGYNCMAPKSQTYDPTNDLLNAMMDLKYIFPGKTITHCRADEAEMIKLIHNCFGATKVTFFNAVKQFCDFKCIDYEAVREGILSVTGFISPEHTQVPGPDGKFGWGGTCFPVNMRAMIGVTKGHFLHDWFSMVEQQNFHNRCVPEISAGEGWHE